MNDRGRGDQAVDVAARPERSDSAPFQGIWKTRNELALAI